jgi:TM2 domain-containing membrane protein YozV
VGKRSSPATPSPTQRRIVAISPDDGAAIDLKQPELAALLAWLVPGLGHFYQGRTRKGVLFMTVVLTTFVLGLWLGNGRVVYASWRQGETRWWFVCQAGVGVAAVPAVIQSMAINGPSREPFWRAGWMTPPLVDGQLVSRRYAERLIQNDPYIVADDFWDRPPYKQFRADQLSMWHHELGRFFELGTLYTVLAGMFNMLIIYDAWAGPMRTAEREKHLAEDETPSPATGADG